MTMPTQARRLYRVTDTRVLGGVASGIAAHLNCSVILIRVAFVVLAAVNGLGALMYAIFWAVLPAAPGSQAKSRSRRQLVPFLALGAGILLVSSMVNNNGGTWSALGWVAGPPRRSRT